MPVPFAGRRMNDLPWTDLQHLAATRLHAADAIDHVKRLADGMNMPGVPGSGREVHDARTDPRRLDASDDHVDPGVARESLGRTLHCLLGWSDLHLDTPCLRSNHSGIVSGKRSGSIVLGSG